MPEKEFVRQQDWLMPPSLDDWIASDHPARFVAEIVEGLELRAIGIVEVPAVLGAPSYNARMLLSVWIYGFMTRTRSSRKLERACQENIPMIWVAGRQRPDHSTLSRFYKRNRKAMKSVFRATVKLAIEAGLVDFALQAIDGTRIGTVSKDSLKSREKLRKLREALDQELAAMDAVEKAEEREGPGNDPPRQSRKKLARQQVRERVQEALDELDRREAVPGGRNDAHVASTSDPDTALMKTSRGLVGGYNAQAAVDGKAQIVVAADVTSCSSDGEQLLPMLAEVQEMTGRQPQTVAADAGYFDMEAIHTVEESGVDPYVPQPRKKVKPYDKANFVYDAETDAYGCPAGKTLRFAFRELVAHGKPADVRVYRCAECRGCPAFGKPGCTTDHEGRRVKRYAHDAELPQYLDKLRGEKARQVRGLRCSTVEPVFASTKEHLGMLRFLLRGLIHVKAEWHLTCAVHNLLKLWRHWWRPAKLAAASAA
jgi:transposase